jgi:hypothetical protein
MQCTVLLFWISLRDFLVREEASRSPERTSNSSEHKLSAFFFYVGQFCLPGFGFTTLRLFNLIKDHIYSTLKKSMMAPHRLRRRWKAMKRWRRRKRRGRKKERKKKRLLRRYF